MHWLPEQQRAFGSALAEGVTPRLAAFFADDAEKLERRFAAYRRNFWANHRNPLAATYRVVEMLVGSAAFHGLATAYVAGHPSANADLNFYGADFGDFLAGDAVAAANPYLPDVARLEWALLEAYGAADAPAFDFAALAAVPPERQVALRPLSAPGLALLASDYPLAAIWYAHQGTDGAARDALLAAIDLAPQPGWTLVVRSRDDAVAPHALSTGAAAFGLACRDGKPLGAALAAAVAAEPGMDVGCLLLDWVGRGWLCGLCDD